MGSSTSRRIEIGDYNVTADETIERLASTEGIGKSRAEIEEMVEQKEQEFQEKLMVEETTEEVERLAVSVVKNDLTNLSNSTGYVGSLEEVSVIPLGYQSREAGRWIVQDSDGMQVGCAVSPPDRPAGLGILIVEETHVDLDHAKSVLQPLNTVRARVGVERVTDPTVKKAGNATYNLRVGEDSILEHVDPNTLDEDDPLAELPAEKEGKRGLVNGNFFPDEEVVTVADFVEHESLVNERGYPAGLGVDMKRFRGEVVDSVKFDFGSGIMTVVDDSIFTEEDIPDELLEDDGNDRRTPGAKVQVDNDFVYGDNSIVDVYGPVSQNPNTKQYSIQAFGIIPIFEEEYDGDIIETGNGPSNSDIEEDTI